MSEAVRKRRRGEPGPVRVWPPTRPPAPGEAVRATCGHCGLDWDVHEALAGFRLRCECEAWVPVPHPLGAPAVVAPAPALPVAALDRPPYSAPREPASRRRAVWPAKPTKLARPRRSARLVDSGLLGTLVLTAAVAVPVALVHANMGALSWAVLWPVMGGVTAVLLGTAALFKRARFLAALRPARVTHCLEGLGVGLLGGASLAGLMAGLPREGRTLQWLFGLIEELGVPVAALALVILPALGHALFFREVYARRLKGLFPARVAAVAAAAALAASHGLVAPALIVFAVALHAAWLRKRAGGAVPGLLEDLALTGVVFGALLAA